MLNTHCDLIYFLLDYRGKGNCSATIVTMKILVDVMMFKKERNFRKQPVSS